MNNSATVRVALRSDAAMLAAVRMAADAASEPQDLGHFQNLLDQSDGWAYVAQAEGCVIGYLVLQRAAHAAVTARAPIQLWQLYVTPAFHGSGIAAQLMSAALNHARNQTHDVMWLGVSEHNARGLAFFQKHGFKAVGRHLVGSAGHAHYDLVMSRDLQ
jgi:ribosomal protein S18 acetylase RimI-like enzyme